MDNVSISNLPYIKKDLFLINDILSKVHINKVELFIEPLDKEYHKQSLMLIEELKVKGYSLSIHGPFRLVNLVSEDDSKEWKDTLWSFKETIDIAKKCNAEFIVLHSNERINNKDTDKELSKKHLREIVDYSIEKGVVPVIENVGVNTNNLFNEKEFLALCNEFNECKVLIDVGHAIINKWNLTMDIKFLKDKIIGYHIHNNDGIGDQHYPIENGVMNYKYFFELYKQYTPNSNVILEYGIDLEGNLYEDIKMLKNI